MKKKKKKTKQTQIHEVLQYSSTNDMEMQKVTNES